ncbi:MAG: hypothetical protein ACLFSY_01140 [Desulfonatronovibrionaceae bacterium]
MSAEKDKRVVEKDREMARELKVIRAHFCLYSKNAGRIQAAFRAWGAGFFALLVVDALQAKRIGKTFASLLKFVI